MTELPDSAADGAAKAATPDLETPVGDPELEAVPAAPSAAAPDQPLPVAPATEETIQVSEAVATPDDATPEPEADTTEPVVDAVPVLPLATAVTDGKPTARP